MCSFAVTQTRVGTATPDAFDLDGASATTATIGTSCFAQFAYLVIPNTGVTVPNYCGTVLAPAPLTTPSTATAATEASTVICNYDYQSISKRNPLTGYKIFINS